MGQPPIKFQISGFVQDEIKKNPGGFLNPILEVRKDQEVEIEGKAPTIYVSDPESQFKIKKTPQGIIVTFTFPIDTDNNRDNGRLYLGDEFRYDPKDSTLLDYRRIPPGKTNLLGNWTSLQERLAALPTLSKDDPAVVAFFQNVVLKLPIPTEMTEEETSVPSGDYLPNLVLKDFKPLSAPQSLEEAHLRRLLNGLPLFTASYQKIPDGLLMLQMGLGALQKGFIESNPALGKLYEKSKNNAELRILAKGLQDLSRGDLTSARSRFLGLQSMNPSARYLIRWLDQYTQAKKSLGTLKVMEMAVSERLARDRNSLGKSVQDHPEKISNLFASLNNKIISGQADTVSEAFRQVEVQGSEEDKTLLANLQSPDFAGGALVDLARASSLTGDLESQSLMSVAYEKLIPEKSMAAASGVFRMMSDDNRSSAFAEAGRQGLLALSGEGNFGDEMDFTTQKITEQLTDPVIVASFLAGQSAFQAGQYFGLSRWGGLGLRSTLLSTALGVSLEAPTFEFTQRALYQASGRKDSFKDFDKGLLRSWLTFGTFRGMGLGMRYGTSYLEKNQILPFGKWTIPLVSHSASFGALHGMGEMERALNLRPREGSWASRLLLDGAFYLQASAIHPLGETLMGEDFSHSIGQLERANVFISQFKSVSPSTGGKASKGPKPSRQRTVSGEISAVDPEEVTRLGTDDLIMDPRTVWIRMESEKAEDGRVVHPEKYFPLSIDKNTWWVGRESTRSQGVLDISIPSDTMEISRNHAQIRLDEKGNYILEPMPREEGSMGLREVSIFMGGWQPLTRPVYIAKGNQLNLGGHKTFVFTSEAAADLSVVNRELDSYHAQISLDAQGNYVLSPLPNLTQGPGEANVALPYGNWEMVTQPILLPKGAMLKIGDSRILHFDVPEPLVPVKRPRPATPPPPPPDDPPPPSRSSPSPLPPELPPKKGSKALAGKIKLSDGQGLKTSKTADESQPTVLGRKNPTIIPPSIEGSPGDPSEPLILLPGQPILGTGPNEPLAPRTAVHNVRIGDWGEASAFTNVGIDKKNLGDPVKYPMKVNEDAFGMGLDQKGRPVFVVGDGMGHYGSGDHASARMVEVVLKTMEEGDQTLGEALVKAHEMILEDNSQRLSNWQKLQMGGSPPAGAGTVAGAFRVDPQGNVEVGLAGDVRLWILKAEGEGGELEIIQPYFPDYYAGVLREKGVFRTTLQMLSAELPQNPVLSALGRESDFPLEIVSEQKPNTPNTILNNALSIPLGKEGEGKRSLYQLQPGDGLLLMSDGIGGIFNREQMKATVQGQKGSAAKLKAIADETSRRLQTYLKFAHDLKEGERAKLPDGNYIDWKGNIFATKDPTDTKALYHFGPDNVVGLLFIYKPAHPIGKVAGQSPGTESPPSPPAGKKGEETTQLGIPLMASPPESVAPGEIPEPLPPPPFDMVKKIVALKPNQKVMLYKLLGLGTTNLTTNQEDFPPLLEGLIVYRGKESETSTYRLLSPGGTHFTFVRQYGEKAGEPQEIQGGNHFILGEIGEEVSFRAGDVTEPTYRIVLDDPEGNGAKLPKVKISYLGREETYPFRSTVPKINFGRHYNPDLFSNEKKWISRHHFDLHIAQMGPQFAYEVSVQCKYGLMVDGYPITRGQTFFLQPGRHEIRSVANQAPDASGQLQTQWDDPILIELPPLEVSFPDWHLAPPPPTPSSPNYSPEHASTRPPPPPQAATVTQAHQSPPAKKPWWKFW